MTWPLRLWHHAWTCLTLASMASILTPGAGTLTSTWQWMNRVLWAIYSTSKAKGAIVISQLDPESLEVKKSWETNIRKNTVANAFMVCGRLYTVASYTAPNTTINFVYDTATNAGRAVAVPFKNKYRYNSMVDYNHAQRKLYAWDNFHMVTYDVRLGRASHGSS
ncbi:Myocilin [Larimichthys crocea]|uniref:Uncharacterized protein n=1 Tax=Larimichthys crocea TaxID=215358 RepID=A0ACD3QSD9_LARCR|nr:Myocilin [Larimichthys crocea]